MDASSRGFFTKIRVEDDAKRGIRTAIWNARDLDHAVMAYVKDKDLAKPPGPPLLDRLEQRVFLGYTMRKFDREPLAKATEEVRLVQLPGDAPQWAKTAD